MPIERLHILKQTILKSMCDLLVDTREERVKQSFNEEIFHWGFYREFRILPFWLFFVIFTISNSSHFPRYLLVTLYLMFCAIWYHLYILKTVKYTHGGLILLRRIKQILSKSINFHSS